VPNGQDDLMRKQYPLRIPDDLWNELTRWADDELRSVNGQIEFILHQAVARRKRSTVSDGAEKEKPPERKPR
jgi:hypothetical protein